MNERIMELKEQAKEVTHWLDGGYTPVYDTNLEKFALLIIEECAKLAEYQGYNQMFGQGGLRTKLHEYFGIENER
jgi:hypothetical protein